MTNAEIRMTNECRMTTLEPLTHHPRVSSFETGQPFNAPSSRFRHSDFVILSTFELRHSSFATHRPPLISAIASARLDGLSLNNPRTALVIVRLRGLRIPRIVMQVWVASST